MLKYSLSGILTFSPERSYRWDLGSQRLEFRWLWNLLRIMCSILYDFAVIFNLLADRRDDYQALSWPKLLRTMSHSSVRRPLSTCFHTSLPLISCYLYCPNQRSLLLTFLRTYFCLQGTVISSGILKCQVPGMWRSCMECPATQIPQPWCQPVLTMPSSFTSSSPMTSARSPYFGHPDSLKYSVPRSYAGSWAPTLTWTIIFINRPEYSTSYRDLRSPIVNIFLSISLHASLLSFALFTVHIGQIKSIISAPTFCAILFT